MRVFSRCSFACVWAQWAALTFIKRAASGLKSGVLQYCKNSVRILFRNPAKQTSKQWSPRRHKQSQVSFRLCPFPYFEFRSCFVLLFPLSVRVLFRYAPFAFGFVALLSRSVSFAFYYAPFAFGFVTLRSRSVSLHSAFRFVTLCSRSITLRSRPASLRAVRVKFRHAPFAFGFVHPVCVRFRYAPFALRFVTPRLRSVSLRFVRVPFHLFTFQVGLLDAPHEEVGLAVDQLDDFLREFAVVFAHRVLQR